MTPVLFDVDGRGVATATLNRPEIGNAYDEELLRMLIAGLEHLAPDPEVRALVLRGAGRHFQAGADINWLSRATQYPPQENYAASMTIARALRVLNEFPKPTIVLVHGACFGGGCGMVCCADVALATPDATFGFTDVRLGLAPTPMSTHMVHALGLRQARRYALTGERFSAEEGVRIGLIHEVVVADQMEARAAEILDAICLGAPGAIALTKHSLLSANGMLLDERKMTLLAHESWTQRHSEEGREGTTAFREKRKPSWYAAHLR